MSEAERYRLGPVRDARSREERARRGDLAAAAAGATASQARVDAAARHVDLVRAKLATARLAHTTYTSAGALARSEQFLVRLRRDLELAIDAHERAVASHRGQQDVVDSARGRLARARADKEVLERHFARWRTERAKLAERRDD